MTYRRISCSFSRVGSSKISETRPFLVRMNAVVVCAYYAGTLLASVLERVEPKVRDIGCSVWLNMPKMPHNVTVPALFSVPGLFSQIPFQRSL